MKNKLIIFDCFGVIFDEIAPVFFERYLSKEKAAVIKDKIFVPADLGQITYDEIFNRISAEMNMDKDSVLREWNSLIRLREEMLPVIKKSSEIADVALLSNAPLGFVEKIFAENNLEPLFDKMFISCNLRMAKPDKAIYLHCVSAFGKDYDEIYMIDDNIKNLEHLPEIGITPIHFTDISCLDSLINT